MSDGGATDPYPSSINEYWSNCSSYYRGNDYARCAASVESGTIKSVRIEIYTILFYETGADVQNDMEIWSSGCVLKSGSSSSSFNKSDYTCASPPDHYYQATANLSTVYSQIIEAITAGLVKIGSVETRGVQSGVQVPLNVGNIGCQGSEQNFNFSIEFGAEPGRKARISNLKAYVCPGPPWPP